jgi:hypothetical protein
MKYERFEQLPLWDAGIELASVYDLTVKPAFRSHYSLRDQIERTAVSISNNTTRWDLSSLFGRPGPDIGKQEAFVGVGLIHQDDPAGKEC